MTFTSWHIEKVGGWIKKIYKSCNLRHWTGWISNVDDTKESCSVHETYVQKEHSCGSSTAWPTWKTGLAWKSRELYTFCGHKKRQQPICIDSLQKCIVTMHFQCIAKATGCHMVPQVSIWRDQTDGQQMN